MEAVEEKTAPEAETAPVAGFEPEILAFCCEH
jgi:hypothetical protein